MKVYDSLPDYTAKEMATKILRECVPNFGIEYFADYYRIPQSRMKEFLTFPDLFADEVREIFIVFFVEPNTKQLKQWNKRKTKKKKSKCLMKGCDRTFYTTKDYHFCKDCTRKRKNLGIDEGVIVGFCK